MRSLIDDYIDDIPKSHTYDLFSYLHNYKDYIIKNTKIDYGLDVDPNNINLTISATPLYESFIITSESADVIFFDVSTSLLLIDLNSMIVTGKLTNSVWVKILEYASCMFLKEKKPNIALLFAANKMAFMESLSDSDLIFDFKFKNLFNENKDKFSSIHHQEFFILAHEISHYLISKGLLNRDELFDNILEEASNKKSLMLPAFMMDGFENTKSKGLFSDACKEEIICDLFAFDLTMKYFYLDGNSNHDEVCLSIVTFMNSLWLLNVIRKDVSMYFRKEWDINFPVILLEEIGNRVSISDLFIDSSMSYNISRTNSDMADSIGSILSFNNNIQYAYKTRTQCFRKYFIPEIILKMIILNYFSSSSSMYFDNLEDSAIYYLGYNNKTTKGKAFMDGDGSFLGNMTEKQLKKFLNRIDTNLCELKGELFHEAEKFMNSKNTFSRYMK